MNVYTKSGDEGQTTSYNGKRLPKDHNVIEIMGCIDSLLASLDIAILLAGASKDKLKQVQKVLWQTAGEISLEGTGKNVKEGITLQHIEELETYIDTHNPGTSDFVRFRTEPGARVNLARVECRRLERRITKLYRDGFIRDEVYQYINRLSDFLYVVSCQLEGDLRSHND